MTQWQQQRVIAMGCGVCGLMVGGATAALEQQSFRVGMLLWGVMSLLWLGLWVWRDAQSLDPLPAYHLAWRDGIIALGLILWAFGWRWWQLDTYPSTLVYDEAQFGWQALAVLHGQIAHPLTSGYRSHPVLFGVAQAAPVVLWGQTVVAIRLASAVIGSLAVGATYGLGRLLWSRWHGLVAALLLSTYPFHLQFSRLGLNNIADTLIGPLVMTWLIVTLRIQRMGAAAATGLLLGLGWYGYHGARLFPLIVIVVLILTPLSWRLRGRLLGVITGGWLITAGPLLLGILRGTADGGQPMWETSLFNPVAFHAAADAAGMTRGALLLENLRRAFLALHAVPDSREFYRFDGGLARGLMGLWMTIGMIGGLWRWRDLGVRVSGVWVISALLFGAALMTQPPSSARLITVSVPVAFFAADGLSMLRRGIQRLGSDWEPIAHGVGVVLVLVTVGQGIRTYFWDYAPQRYIGATGDFEATEVGKALHGIPSTSQVIILDAAPTIHDRESLRWLTGVTATEPLEPTALDTVQLSAASWVIVAPQHHCPYLAAWAQTVPGGRWGATPALTARGFSIPDGWTVAPDPARGLYCFYGTAVPDR